MVKALLILILAVTVTAWGQPTAPDDTGQYVRSTGTKTAGYCLVWDAYGRAVSATCGAGGGEVNAGANLGSGAVIYTGKSGVNLQFRSFTVGSNKLSVTQNANDIAFDVLPANILLSALGGTLNLAQIAQGGATTGQLLQWNGTNWAPASTGGGGGPANTDALAEGSTNLYYTQARARAALSVAGILSYNNGTGVFSCSNCADITSSYANPAWISALAWSKLTGVPSYQLVSEKGSANGYASLGAGGLVPAAQLGTGTANSTVFLRGDGVWTNPAGTVNVLLAGSSIGTRPGLNFISGAGFTWAATDDAGNNRVNITGTADTAVMLSRATGTSGVDNTCIPASGSATTFTCNPAGNALAAYTNGMRLMFRPDATCSGSPTLNISGLGAKNLYASDGTTAASCTNGLSYWLVYNTALNGAAGGWVFPSGGVSGTVPVSQGGTGATTLTDRGVLVGRGTGAVEAVGPGTAGQPLVSNGAGSNPSYQDYPASARLARLPLVFISDQQLGGATTAACGAFTGVTAASPPVVTCTGSHGLSDGDRVWVSGVVGMTGVNDTNSTVSTVDVLTSTTFSLLGKTGTGTWSSGGTASVPNRNWASGNSKLNFVSSATKANRFLPIAVDTLFTGISVRGSEGTAQPGTGPLVCALWLVGLSTGYTESRSALQVIFPAGESAGNPVYTASGSETVLAGQKVAINCDNFATSASTFPVITVQ